jgi:hypothetical protein
MEYKLRLMIISVVLFCLLPAVVLGAGDSCYKKLYIDGVLVDEAEATPYGLEWPYERITIGAEGNRWYLYNEYIGKLDEFAIYAGVLPDPCIAAHYAAKDSNTAYYAAVDHDNPLLWLRFEDSSTANEAFCKNSGWIGIDANYIQTGGGAIQQVAGINAGSLAINIPDRVNHPTDANINAQGHCVDVWDGNGDFGEDWDGDVTVELWASYIDLNDYPRFFQHNGAWEIVRSYGLVAQLNDGNTFAVLGGVNNYMDFTNDINDGQWHHIVVTYDSTYAPPNLPPVGPYIDEVAADNPVLWLRFEDAQPRDYSVADGNHWVGYGGGTNVVEKVGGIGNSLYLDGSTSSYAAAANGPNYPNPVTDYNDNYAFAPNDITFEIWYKTLPAGEPQPEDYAYFFQQVGTWLNEPLAPAVGNAGTQVRIWGGSEGWYTGVPTELDGEWHQIVVTYDENDPCNMIAQLYLDGFIEGTHSFNGANAKLGPELSHVMVGARNDLGYTYNAWTGYLDEFAIYEGILDPNRILAHYSAFQPDDCNEVMERGWVSGEWTVVDRNRNCKVDFGDFAIFAQEWALCNKPGGDAGCSRNW